MIVINAESTTLVNSTADRAHSPLLHKEEFVLIQGHVVVVLEVVAMLQPRGVVRISCPIVFDVGAFAVEASTSDARPRLLRLNEPVKGLVFQAAFTLLHGYMLH
jgi:hypothetical protein